MKKQSFFLLFFVFLIVGMTSLVYLEYIEVKKSEIEKNLYSDEMAFMQKSVASMIEEKKKATTAIAITLASNDTLFLLVKDAQKLKAKINFLIKEFRQNTDYKNIWFYIVDKSYSSLYKSSQEDSFLSVDQREFKEVIEKEHVVSIMGVDSFGIAIKSIAPFYNESKSVAGAVAIVSHFNSIEKRLKKLDIDSLIVVKKGISKSLTHPFSNFFIDGYYIANLNVNSEIVNYVKKRGISSITTDSNQLRDGYIIVNFPLKDMNNKTIAYYILFKKTADISKTDSQFFLFKGMAYGFGLVVIFFILLLSFFYLRTRKLKRYYKSIIDATTNILLICDGHTLLSANKAFFNYFKKYKNLDEFKKEHRCICDFFQEDDGYMHRYMDGEYWIDYIAKHPKFYHKAKLLIEGKIYYFSLSLSTISDDLDHTSLILSDISEQELYKQELEYLTLSDPLTHVGNRRKYEKRIEEEMSRACRYKTPLSLVLFDLDYFKQVNDQYGHQVGDEVLKEVSKVVAKSLREVDELFRIGGEEFIIIVPHTTEDDAFALAEKLRKLIEENTKVVPVSASFGVTQYHICEDKEQFFDRVDKALYKAKKDGRNRVVAL